MQPLISIIIPVYNVEKYIKFCLDSIIKQKVKNDLEIICIDDGSTDKSGIICDEYSKIDKRFKVIHQENKGVSFSRNIGLKFAKGKYIGWIDPDDYISDDWWESIKLLLKNDTIDILFFDYTIVNKGKYVKKRFASDSRYLDMKEFLEEITIDRRIQNQLWQKIFRRNLMEKIAFPENISLMEDYAVLHKIVLEAKNIYYLSKSLYFYRIRKNSIVTDDTLSIDKNYKAFLIAKQRYIFLLNNAIDMPKIGYLMRALDVCIRFYKMNRDGRNKNKEKYIECKKEIDLNKKYICSYNDCDLSIKIKFLLYKFNLLRLVIILKKII